MQSCMRCESLPFICTRLAVWDGQQRLWLSWEEVEGWAQKLGVPTTPVIMQGMLLPKYGSYNKTIATMIGW